MLKAILEAERVQLPGYRARQQAEAAGRNRAEGFSLRIWCSTKRAAEEPKNVQELGIAVSLMVGLL